MKLKRWQVASVNKENAKRMADELGIPYLIGLMLDVRGINSSEKALSFLGNDNEDVIADPFTIKDMDRAVERINNAIENGEKIAVYGDYDADGVTATTILYSYLEYAGAEAVYYIPDREREGYGMNKAAVKSLADDGVSLIVTVDNGVSSIEEVKYASELGIDVVITDHHRPREVLPDAAAVVNPHRKDCPSSFKELAGVGVAFKLITALEGEYADIENLLENYAELVAIGTIGDVVSLTGENRAFVRAGLKYMPHTDNIGLRALMENAAVDHAAVSAGDVAFGIVPRINATGRMDSSEISVRLLLSEVPDEAGKLAIEVGHNNNLRKACEVEILEKVKQQLKREPERLNEQVLIVEGEGWHHGVIGIVASRLLDKYGKPTLVISITGDEAKGSGRSIEGFSLFDAIHTNGKYLTKYGGHPMAAGFSLKTENLLSFRKAIYKYASDLKTPLVQTIKLDCKLKPEALSVEIPKRLKMLEPFGTDNPSPIFGLFGVTLTRITPVGAGKHLRLDFSKNGGEVQCMLFGVSEEQFAYNVGDVVDLAVQLSAKEFRGEESLTVTIKEIRVSDLDYDAIILDYNSYEKYKRNALLNEEDTMRLLPTREDFKVIYTLIRNLKGWSGSMTALYKHVMDKVRYGRFLVILQAMRELKLIGCRQQSERLIVTVAPVNGKVNLDDAQILRTIKELSKGDYNE